ncbi:MAG TPA: GNAT family N-acetyltransferase [Mycobacteriales bacterium]|nr:GNAT family N-acetyltransferase [Mycobacteriales bacterium]
MALTPLGSAAEVLVATGHEPFARGSLRRTDVRGWLGESAVAWVGTDAEERVPYLSALGPPDRVAALLAELLPELSPRQRLSVPRGTAALLPAWVQLEGPVDWDVRWLSGPPPRQPGEQLVAPDPDEVAVKGLLDAGASALPGDPAVRRWWGITDADGALRACAADTSAATGVGHLSSVAVAVESRGRGLGKAITAAAARALFEQGCDVVTLGSYQANVAATALYDALGFAAGHAFTSGRLLQRSRW